MEIFRVDNILREIENYNINRDNCIEFLLQDKGRSDDLAFFFYKSGLLQLIECREHLDKMIAFYYGVDNVYSIEEDIAGVYKAFLRGDNKVLVDLFKYAEFITADFCKLFGNDEIDFSEISSPIFIGGIRFWLKKLDAYIKYKGSNPNELSARRMDKQQIDDRAKLYDSKIKVIVDKIKKYLEGIGADSLLNELNLDVVFQEDFDEEFISFCGRFNSYYNFVVQYHRLINDIIAMTSVIKSYRKIEKSILGGRTLGDICLMIRNSLFGEENLTFRKNVLKPNRRIMAEAPLPEDIEYYFSRLNSQFRNCIEEIDMDLFIRKCADVHYDFLRVHPFSDGNGRTARVLLTTMLLSRNIMLPTLYFDYDGKCNFYITSDTALDGDYSNVEQNLFVALAYYYPNVLPNVLQTGKSYYGMSDRVGVIKR